MVIIIECQKNIKIIQFNNIINHKASFMHNISLIKNHGKSNVCHLT
jgi:hypothetical protein